MNNCNLICIIQARLTSSRLPNKVLKKINNKNSLQIIHEKLKKIKEIDEIVFAIPNNKMNMPLKKFLLKNNYKVFCGSEKNVLSRYYKTAQYYNAENILRITADCPLIDYKIIRKLIKNFFELNYDYGSNTIIRTFPDGYDAEIFKFNTLKKTFIKSTKSFDKEHVTSYMKSEKSFKKYILKNKIDYSFLRLTLDTKKDYEFIKFLFEKFKKIQDIYLADIINFYKKNPKIFSNYIFKFNNDIDEANKGIQLYKKAKNIIPGGTMLLTKKPEMFLPNKWPAYFSKAKGINVWDMENKKYLDFSYMGVGTNILGYGNEEVDEAVQNTVNAGNLSTLNCPEEVYLADKIIKLHPWSQMVKFARTGGEANAIAIRIARSFSDKQNIAVCGYHGWHDWYLALNLKNKNNLDSFLIKNLSIKGVPSNLKETIFSFQYNDFDQLNYLIKNKNIGIIKMEVTRNLSPNDNFLKKIRRVCDKNKIVLIFDECTSGFRKNLGGIHKLYDVNPDLCMFSKAIGNGYAISAIVGKKNIMNYANKTFISSTFWTERIGPTAALKTLQVMEREKSWKTICRQGKKIKSGWSKIFHKYGLDVSISGIDSLPIFNFKSENHNLFKTFITNEMLRHNILATNTCYMSIKHDDKYIEEYLYYFDAVISQLSNYVYDKKKYDLNFDKRNLSHSGLQRFN